MTLLDISFMPTKCLRNNLSSLRLNFSISVFQLHHFPWIVTKFSSNVFWTVSNSSSEVFFSFTCSWLKIKCPGVPNGFSVHRKSLFSLPVLTVIYISILILQSFLELFLTGFFSYFI